MNGYKYSLALGSPALKTWSFLIAIVLSSISLSFAQEPTWTQKFPAQHPSANAGVMAYDSARQEVVQLTYCRPPGADETWIWDGITWTQKFPATIPTAGCAGTMIYDSARSEVVLFGGSNLDFGETNETWVWDGTNWTQRFPASSPPRRQSAAGAWDAARQEFVLFGGSVQPGPTLLGDTWVWNGTNWTQKFPAHSPPARAIHVMAYDAARQQVVLFGGSPCTSCMVADTWVWDGTDWTQKFPSTHPPERFGPFMAYDTVSQQMVLFGGAGLPCCSITLGDTWVWDGTNWTQKFPAATPPPRTGRQSIASDSARREIVLFGGSDQCCLSFEDTWVWGTAFAAQVQAPIAADGSSVFNSKRGVVPVKFTLTENGTSTCNLPAATISLFRTSGGSPGPITEGDYIMPSDSGSNFRVSDCQYVYNLGTGLLGVGTYQVKISIGGIEVGSANFGLD